MNWDADYERPEQQRWWPEPELIRMVTRRWPNGVLEDENDEESLEHAHEIRRAKAVLDIGCGNGRNLWPLYEHGFGCYGVDGSLRAIAAALEFAEKRDFAAYFNHWTGLPKLEQHDNQFDLVVDCQTFQHLPWEQHAAAYSEVYRVLKPGGVFWSMHWAVGDAQHLYPSHPELERRSVEEQRDCIKACGFHIDACAIVSRVTFSGGNLEDRIIGRWAILEASKPKET